MGMYSVLWVLSDANAARLLADPPLAWRLFAPDDSEAEAFDRERLAPRQPWWRRLFSKGARAAGTNAAPEALVLVPPEGESCDLDKAWHGLHFLLTGGADGDGTPLSFLVSGGTALAELDHSYGPPRLLSSADVRRIHAALARLSDDDLRARFDGARMDELDVYPTIWTRPVEEDDALGWLMDNVAPLRALVERAVAARCGLLVELS
jgi:hypothetical protein